MSSVSICLPVYNGAKYLSQAIESALSQSFEDFELLIANDCSRDDSSAVMDKYAKHDKRIKAWTNQTNLGHYGNYNACLKQATGRYIKLFAQDDILHPQLLARQVSVLENNPNVTLVNCARRWIDADGQPIKVESALDIKLTKPFNFDTTVPGKDAISSTLGESTNWLGEPSSQMYPSRFIDGGFNESFRQIGDIEHNYRVLQHGDFYFIAEELCNFRKHSDSWTTTNSTELSTYLEWLLLASKYKKYLDRAGLTSEAYCLNFVRAWIRNLEEVMYQSACLSKPDREKLLKELCGNVDPLSLFECGKNAQRNSSQEYRALGAIALLQGALLANELRLVNEEVARPYTQIVPANETLVAARPGIVEALHGLKQTLVERDKEITRLRLALSEMGNSLSWKVTEPLRKLKAHAPRKSEGHFE